MVRICRPEAPKVSRRAVFNSSRICHIQCVSETVNLLRKVLDQSPDSGPIFSSDAFSFCSTMQKMKFHTSSRS
jgi:hypothetical protein